MADPFGHGICFIEFLGRGYDEIADALRVARIERSEIRGRRAPP